MLLVLTVFQLWAQESESIKRHVQIGDARFWLVESPTEKDQRLALLGPEELYIVDGNLTKDAVFVFDSNFPDFIEKWQLEIYDGKDSSLRQPVYVIEGNWLPIGEDIIWDGRLFTGDLEKMDSIQYRLRVFGSKNQSGFTRIKHAPIYKGREQRSFADIEKDKKTWFEKLKSRNDLEKLHFGLPGGIIRVYGENLPPNGFFAIGSYVYPVGLNDRAEIVRHIPPGSYSIPVSLWGSNDEGIGEAVLDANIEKEYFFMVALADITVGQNGVSGAVDLVEDDSHFDETVYVDGRFAFYLKGKIKGKYLLTAQLDTGEDDITEVFQDLDRRDSSRLFRRIDPDRFYPIYGDNSTITRDVDTQGKFYVRLEWDDSKITWGNFNSGIGGTEYSNYNRGLYGAQVDLRSTSTTKYGDRRAIATVFASTTETRAAHDELLGTGGSLYYLNNQDLALGSAKVAVEVRELSSNRVKERIELQEGRDYEIDDFQGRIQLKRPLRPEGAKQLLSIVRDEPLEGDDVFLVVDYEYIPTAVGSTENTSYGARGKLWLGDHIGIGATVLQEQRSSADFSKLGADVTLKFGKNSHINAEFATSEAGQDIDYGLSTDGGLTYDESNFNASNIAFAIADGGSGYAEGVTNDVEFTGTRGSRAIGTVTVANGEVVNIDLNFINAVPGDTLTTNDLAFGAGATLVTATADGDALSINGKFDIADLFGEKRAGQQVGVWYRTQDSGFDSVQFNTDNTQNTNYGVEGQFKVGKRFTISGRATVNEVENESERIQYGVNAKYAINDLFSIATEYVYQESDTGLSSDNPINQASDTIGAQAQFRILDNLSLSATGQTLLSSTDPDASNTFYGIGINYDITKNIGLKGEYFDGDNGSGSRFGINYKGNVNDRNSFYVNYDTESLGSTDNKIALGHRSQLTDKLSVFQEHRFNNQLSSNDRGQSYGINYIFNDRWTLSAETYLGDVETDDATTDERQAYSFSSEYAGGGYNIVNRIEFRDDINDGTNVRQWLTTNRVNVSLNDALNLRAKVDYSQTENITDDSGVAEFGEVDLGLAYRPVTNDRLNVLALYTYQYDQDPQQNFGEVGIEGNFLDELAHVLSIDAIYDITPYLEVGAKVALRNAQVRETRGVGSFTDVNTFLYVLRTRYNFWSKFNVLAEWRSLSVDEAQDERNGFLAALEYHLNNNFVFGLGYNFTDFNDDLTNLDFDSNGWFLSLVGKY